jgi:hypothetical protein
VPNPDRCEASEALEAEKARSACLQAGSKQFQKFLTFMEPCSSFVITLAARRRFSSTRSAEQAVQKRASNAVGSDMGRDGNVREIELRDLAQRRAAMSTRAKGRTGNQTAPNAIEKQTGSLNSAAADAPANEEIQLRAYRIHVECGGQHGCDLENWLQAEREPTEERRGGPSGKDGARRGWVTSLDADD